MKQILVMLIAVALVGCTKSIVLPVDETLGHEETVVRLKKLLNDNMILAYGLTTLQGGTEESVSPTKTRLRYEHSIPQPPPSLYTPDVSYDWTYIDIDTSQKRKVEISVKTYRHGNLINHRQHEVESKIIENLGILKERANLALQPTPKTGTTDNAKPAKQTPIPRDGGR